MSRSKAKLSARIDSGLVEVKSKFEAEFRRFSVGRQKSLRFDEFYQLVEDLHSLQTLPFIITYTDHDGDLLPINNDENLAVALLSAQPVLHLHIQQKGQSTLEVSGYGTAQRRRNKLSKFVPTSVNDVRSPQVTISLPEDFRRVSAIIDVDVVPATQRRVRLMKSGVDANKPLGFYIRDGTSIRVTPNGVEKVPAIFISRLVPGGIAESTGLLAVNDEVMEVNGIEVGGKTLDQVTDMMVANSANMIITVKPANQNNNVQRRGMAPSAPLVPLRTSPLASNSYRLAAAAALGETNEAMVEHDDEDEVKEYVKDSGDLNESVSFTRAAWGSQNAQMDSITNKMTTVGPNSSDTSTSKNEVAERLNGISLQTEKPTSSPDCNKQAGYPNRILSPHETPAKVSTYGADDTVSDEMDLAKSAPKLSSSVESKQTSSVRVVFTPIEDL